MYKPPPTPSSGQTLLNFQTKDSSGEYWKFEQEVVRRVLVKMIIVDELPFSFVENEGFKKFMSIAKPLFRIPSRRIITRDCYDVYGELRLSLKKSFGEIQPRVYLTIDVWILVQRINYMCLTAHFIDGDWVLHKRILNFCPITSHKGEHLSECISNCLLDWKLDNVFTVTVDSASSNNVAVSALSKKLDMWGTNVMDGKHLHVRCMAHILNLIVQDGLKEIGPSIKMVSQMIKYVRSSPAKTRNFTKYCEMQKIECSKMLSLDVPTRWNFTYLMLETAEKIEKAFDRFDLYDDNFNSYLSTNVCEDGSVAGSRYVTCNVHFEDICELDSYLKECMTSDDVELCKIAMGMKEKFKNYWGTPKKINKMIFIASMLDPRNKFEYVSFSLEELLEIEMGKKVSHEVETYLKNLFVFYVRKYSKGSKNNSSSSGYTSSDLSGSDSSKSGVPQSLNTNTLRNKLYMKKKARDYGIIGGTKSELDKYLGEDQEPVPEPGYKFEYEDFDILNWWKVNSPRFPILSLLARDVLAIPMSSVGQVMPPKSKAHSAIWEHYENGLMVVNAYLMYVFGLLSIAYFYKLQTRLRSEGGIMALLGMVRCRHPDLLSQVGRGITNFSKYKSRVST
ncbi:zinc finger BED domain-containing protein RICESLEEPER 2-like [Capsicum chacoense]